LSGIVSIRPKMKMTHEPAVSDDAVQQARPSAEIRTPATKTDLTIRAGSVTNITPDWQRERRNTAIETTITRSGFTGRSSDRIAPRFQIVSA